jgi:hypothetical protein
MAYSRHFLILAACAGLMAWISQSSIAPSLLLAFALYGALHAAALVLALKPRRLVWRHGLFIAAAAGLSVVTLAIGMWSRHVAAMLPATMGRYLLLAFLAATGALTYGLAIRLFGILAVTARTIGKIAVGCMVAAVVALWSVTVAGALGPWWIAVFWWYAFSAGLWCFHGRLDDQGLSAERTCSGRTPSPKN